jgi:hypothetical protein
MWCDYLAETGHFIGRMTVRRLFNYMRCCIDILKIDLPSQAVNGSFVLSDRDVLARQCKTDEKR